MAFDPRLVLTLWLALMKWPESPPNFPPGPEPLPAIGSKELFRTSSRTTTLRSLANRYGPVLSFYKPDKFWVYLQDLQSVLNVSQSQEMDLKPLMDWAFEAFLSDDDGVRRGAHLTNGSEWLMNHRVTVLALDQGIATDAFRRVVKGQVEGLERKIEANATGTLKVDVTTFMPLVMNVLWSLIAGAPLSQQQADLSYLFAITYEFDKISTGPLAKFPLPQIMPNVTGYNKIKQMRNNIWRMFLRDLPQNINSADMVRPNIFTAYLNYTGASCWTTDENLKALVVENLAGVGSTSSSLGWAALFLTAFPTVQDILADEIAQVLGDNDPTFQDMSRMHKMRAFLDETLRMASTSHFSFGVMSNSSFTLGQYQLPRMTPVLYGLFAMNKDNTSWTDPDTFNIDRHLDADGRYTRHPHYASFSFGRRKCSGENTVKTIMFYTLTTLLQKYHLLPAGAEAPDATIHEHDEGSVFQPFEVQFMPRIWGTTG